MPQIPPFRPDAGELVSSTISNVLMTANGYIPRPTLAAAPGAAVFASGAQCRGAFGGLVPNGAFNGFLASATKIYKLSASYGYTDLAVAFTVPTGEDESFSQFGVYMLCSNATDGVYAYNMDTPAGLNAVSGAPAARVIFASNNMVVALGDGTNKQRLATSAFGDHTNWTTKGASKQDMNDGGAFTGGGDLGQRRAVILQQEAVRTMTWGNAGGGALFSLEKVLGGDDVGCVHPRAQATINGRCLFLHTDGWHVTDGLTVVNVGANKINGWFLARCADIKKVYVTADPVKNIFRIRYRSTSCNSDIIFDDILDYNYILDEWLPGTEQTVAIFRMATPGYVLDGLDTFGALDAWSSYPLDSDFWQGGNNPVQSGLNAASKFGFFDGPAAAATLETNTQADGLSYLVNRCEPLTDDSEATVQLGVKRKLSDTITWKTAETIRDSGSVPLRGRGRYQRYRVNHAAGAVWTRDQGIGGTEPKAAAPR